MPSLPLEPGQTLAFDFSAHGRGRVVVHAAWTAREIRAAVERIVDGWRLPPLGETSRLPADKGARMVIKPNLNNDLVALTGNSVDFRVLLSLIRALLGLGYTDITVADGPNVGVDRRGIDSFARLRVDGLCEHLGVRLVNLNRQDGERVHLEAGAEPVVPAIIRDADCLISVPRIKTHAEVLLSCAMKNWVGIARGQDKRHMHYDLGRNIAAMNAVVKPHLILVDGIVGMEGNGPGDGDPFALGVLISSDETVLNDLVVARLMAMDWRSIPYLRHASSHGLVPDDLALTIQRRVPVLRAIRLPPPRSRLSRLSEDRRLLWLKQAVRPLVDRPGVAELAYRLRIVQDVYDRRDSTIRVVGRTHDKCGDCRRCEESCPMGLSREAIGDPTEHDPCVQCLYCWFVCPHDAIRVEGEARHLQRQVDRYRKIIASL